MRSIALLKPAALLLLMIMAGCASDKPTRLYVLSALAEQPAQVSAQGVAIGVGPITLPKYLDRPQIVTRVEGNSLNQADLDQWGGDLNDNITRVLATNLSDLLSTDRVSLYPWSDRAPVDYQVSLDITRFEQDTDGSVVLDVFWTLSDTKGGAALVMRRSTYRDKTASQAASGASPAGGRPYDGLVAAMSRDLAALSRDVAAAITAAKGS